MAPFHRLDPLLHQFLVSHHHMRTHLQLSPPHHLSCTTTHDDQQWLAAPTSIPFHQLKFTGIHSLHHPTGTKPSPEGSWPCVMASPTCSMAGDHPVVSALPSQHRRPTNNLPQIHAHPADLPHTNNPLGQRWLPTWRGGRRRTSIELSLSFSLSAFSSFCFSDRTLTSFDDLEFRLMIKAMAMVNFGGWITEKCFFKWFQGFTHEWHGDCVLGRFF
jgi:hypothetical protein